MVVFYLTQAVSNSILQSTCPILGKFIALFLLLRPWVNCAKSLNKMFNKSLHFLPLKLIYTSDFKIPFRYAFSLPKYHPWLLKMHLTVILTYSYHQNLREARYDTQHDIMLPANYAECRNYAHYAERRNGECRGADKYTEKTVKRTVKWHF